MSSLRFSTTDLANWCLFFVFYTIKLKLIDISCFAGGTTSIFESPLHWFIFYILLKIMACFELCYVSLHCLFVSIAMWSLIGCVKLAYWRLQFVSFISLVIFLIVWKMNFLKNLKKSIFYFHFILFLVPLFPT